MQFLGTIEPLSIYITLDTRAKAGEYVRVTFALSPFN
jgi:hypothetical protein